MSTGGATSDDELFARDMQMALDLQEEEERRAGHSGKKKRSSPRNGYVDQDGFISQGHMTGAANHMLYVLCETDGKPVEMLVDSGASSSAISSVMVQKLNLSHKLSPRVAGRASGVGSANILGVVENVACSIGHVEFRLYFMVLESSVPFLILGLDQMRRFKCVIDLEDNQLCFGGKDGVSVPFLTKELASQAAATSFMLPSQGQPSTPVGKGRIISTTTSVLPVEPEGEGTGTSTKEGGGIAKLFGTKKKPAPKSN